MNIVIDIGNTNIKAAIFSENRMIDKFVIKAVAPFNIDKWQYFTFQNAILSGSGNTKMVAWESIKAINKQVFDNKMMKGIEISYLTPLTLGQDRWLNAYASTKLYPHSNNLIIDLGTCLTTTFVNEKQQLKGGSISPGLRLRAKSLNDYTYKLPLVDMMTMESRFIGSNTEESIWSGVYYGILYEIEGLIHQYRSNFNDLKVILTGGDAHFFENRIKSKIFADTNLTLKGLNYLLMTI